jgi:hypothetical protein
VPEPIDKPPLVNAITPKLAYLSNQIRSVSSRGMQHIKNQIKDTIDSQLT